MPERATRRRPSPLPLAARALLASLATVGAAQEPPREPAGDPPRAEPWRLTPALGLPDWLRISGEVRLRQEAIDGQFRATPRLDDRDSYFVMRSLLKVEAALDPVGATLEMIDARQYGAGEGSVLNTTIVNTTDFLQGNLDVGLGALGDGEHALRAGRMTIDLGSRRLVARNQFRNTINAFDGVSWEWSTEGGTKARVFWTLPVNRRPNDRPSLLDNDFEFDDQGTDFQFYGGFVGTDLGDAGDLEIYTYVLDDDRSIRRGMLYTPGLRLLRAPAKAAIDYEVESALQLGESPQAVGGPDVDHLAWFAHASIGYTFDAPWRPRVRVAYDYASGDRDPNDDENNRFDTLFGARRFEYGPTGFYGAVLRSNLSSPEIRVTAKPAANTELMAAFRGVWLAEARDAWIPAVVRDPTGAAGRHVGEQVEARVRYDVVPKNVRVEVGGAYLFAGSYQDRAPGARAQDTAYGYAQMVLTF